MATDSPFDASAMGVGHIHADHYYTTPLDKVRQRLRRSGQLPLAISFYCRTPYSFRRFEVIDFVKELAPRWGVLKLIMDQTHYATLFNGVIESPHLEKLHIHSHSEGNTIHPSDCAIHHGFAMSS